MATVTLVNRTRRPRRGLTLNLTPKVAQVPIETRTMEESRSGNRAVRVRTKMVPDSIHVPYGQRVEVDEKAAQAPEVAAAIKRRDLRVERPEKKTSGSPRTRRRTRG